jgi:hypothetical protein
MSADPQFDGDLALAGYAAAIGNGSPDFAGMDFGALESHDGAETRAGLTSTYREIIAGKKKTNLSRGWFFIGRPPQSRTGHQRILVCVAFTTPWTMPSP